MDSATHLQGFPSNALILQEVITSFAHATQVYIIAYVEAGGNHMHEIEWQ
jgi:hypothetical protein